MPSRSVCSFRSKDVSIAFQIGFVGVQCLACEVLLSIQWPLSPLSYDSGLYIAGKVLDSIAVDIGADKSSKVGISMVPNTDRTMLINSRITGLLDCEIGSSPYLLKIVMVI